MPPTEQDQWIAATFGVAPDAYAGQSSAPVQAQHRSPEVADTMADTGADFETALLDLNQSVDPGMSNADAQHYVGMSVMGASAPAGGSKQVLEFKRTFGKKFTSELPLLGGCLRAKFSANVAVSGSLETVAGEADPAVSVVIENNSIAGTVATAWHDENGVKAFGWHGVFTDVKTSGGVKLDEGIQIEFAASGKLACGTELSFKLVLLKIDEQKKIEFVKCSIGVELGILDFPSYSQPLGPYLLKEVKIAPVVGVEIEPDWEKIVERYLVQFATDTAVGMGARAGAQAARAGAEVGVEAAAEEGAMGLGTAAGMDLAIAAGPLVIALSAIPAGYFSIKENHEMGEVGAKCRKATKEFLEGYLVGILGGGEPGGEFEVAGYSRGKDALAAAAQQLMKENPGMTLDDVKDAIASQSDQILQHVGPGFTKQVQDAFWTDYRDNHKGGGYAYKRSIAYGGIFGHAPPGPV